jgi:hypothetical protein
MLLFVIAVVNGPQAVVGASEKLATGAISNVPPQVKLKPTVLPGEVVV